MANKLKNVTWVLGDAPCKTLKNAATIEELTTFAENIHTYLMQHCLN